MVIDSRSVSFLIALSVCLITLAFLSLLGDSSAEVLLVGSSISFASSFILFYFTLEFLVFKEINRIYSSLERLRRNDTEYRVQSGSLSLSLIKRIDKEIEEYAYAKELEISNLKQLEMYRREFLADVSHELKTPIFAAQGYVLTLLDGAVEDPKVRMKFLKKAAKNLNGLDGLVQDLLTLSQIESGVVKMNYEVFDLQKMVMDVFDQLDSKANKKKVVLQLTNTYTEGVYVEADYNRINQVFINLVNNAIKYNKKNGWVKVSIRNNDVEDGKVCITVSDNGFGISSEHIDRIFERFYRVEKSRSKKQGGSGLGLAIVKHILESHGTKITVQSGTSQGTTFKFKLDKATLTNELTEI